MVKRKAENITMSIRRNLYQDFYLQADYVPPQNVGVGDVYHSDGNVIQVPPILRNAEFTDTGVYHTDIVQYDQSGRLVPTGAVLTDIGVDRVLAEHETHHHSYAVGVPLSVADAAYYDALLASRFDRVTVSRRDQNYLTRPDLYDPPT